MLDPRPDAEVALLSAASSAHLDLDLPLLVEALSALGQRPAVVDWHDDGHDWSAHRVVVVRSTWDYTDHVDAFLATLARIDAATTLANPVAVMLADVDKRYLVRLAAAGIPVVPTTVVEVGEEPALPDGVAFVVKPVVSAGARDTERYGVDDDQQARDHVARLHEQGRAALVQPYVAGVDAHGETGLVFLGDRFSHGFRKGPILRPGATFVEGLYREEQIEPRVPSPEERTGAEAVLDALDVVSPGSDRGGLLYARVDLVPGPEGPMLMELELVEPSLFLDMDTAAPARAAAAIVEHLGTLRGRGMGEREAGRGPTIVVPPPRPA